MLSAIHKFNSSRCHWSRLYSSYVALTSERYSVQRKNFSKVEDSDLKLFESIVGDGNVITSGLDGHNTDWIKTCRGQSEVMLRPGSADEVSAILSHCNKNKMAVCPQGGNTGLVGGSVPVFDEIIISMSRLNKILSIDNQGGILTCQAGCILEKLDSDLAGHDLMMPLDLGAKGSCQIGGNLSTNAGGIRLLRYGSLHGSTLGLQVVLADGRILDHLNPLIKDNTGYDLKHLFIGAEGTLGLITAASINCPSKPNAVNAAMLASPSYSSCLNVLTAAKRHLGEILSAFEFVDAESRRVVVENLALDYPIDGSPFYLLIETHGSNDEHDKEKIDQFLEHLMTEGLITNGVMAHDQKQLHHMWALRERIAEALLADGYCYKYDISLPYDCWYDIVEEFRRRLEGTQCLKVTGYGHLGDGNLHLNMTSREYDPEVMSVIEPFVYDFTSRHSGSISAEHGLGFKKSQFIYHSKSREMVELMKTLKTSLDPNGILNPYKYLPDS